MRREERDDHCSRAASLAAQSILHLYQRKRIAQVRSELHERYPGSMLTHAAVRAVIVAVIDMSEGSRLELCVFHARTLVPVACALLLYNSYRIEDGRILYVPSNPLNSWPVIS